ncbi:hypothetical protein K1X76_07615 [bacterium]|nr:hypothetical protein [bacterium]
MGKINATPPVHPGHHHTKQKYNPLALKSPLGDVDTNHQGSIGFTAGGLLDGDNKTPNYRFFGDYAATFGDMMNFTVGAVAVVDGGITGKKDTGLDGYAGQSVGLRLAAAPTLIPGGIADFTIGARENFVDGDVHPQITVGANGSLLVGPLTMNILGLDAGVKALIDPQSGHTNFELTAGVRAFFR